MTRGTRGLSLAIQRREQWNPEIKGYGRVVDPAPLAALVNELITAQAAAPASALKWERQKTLSAQNNTSARALQAAEAAAQHDQLAIQSARDRILLGWGAALAGRNDLTHFVQLLTSRQAVLLRVDLPGGESLAAPAPGARVVDPVRQDDPGQVPRPGDGRGPDDPRPGIRFFRPAQ